MNWMTSGRHRALRTKRGKKRSEMHFPAHVQRELTRVRRHPLAQTVEASARNSDGTAWYIRPVMDFNQSHDIQMLELAREAATGMLPTRTEATSTTGTQRKEAEDQEATAPQAVQVKKTVERRCVFTPVKANRQRPRATEQVTGKKKPPSPPPRDLLLFNEGEQLAKPASDRGVSSGQTTGQTRQAESQKTKFARFEDNPGSQKHKKASQRQQPETPSLPFYAASSSSDDETPDPIGCKRGSQPSGRFSPEAWKLKGGMVANPVHQEHAPRPSRLNLFQSIEQEIHSKRRSLVEFNRSPSEAGGSSETHSLRASQPFRELHEEQSPPREHPTQYASFEHLTPAASLRTDEYVSSAQDLKRRRCSSPPKEDPSEQRFSQGTVKVDDKYASPEPTSSQESLVLPPPVDWAKGLVTRTVEEHIKQAADPVDASSPHQDGEFVEPLFSGSKVQPLSWPFGCDGTHDVCSMKVTHSSATKWTISSRTNMIFSKFTEGQRSQTEDNTGLVDEHSALQQRLDEEGAVTLYLFTLLQCHRVDEECRNATVTLNPSYEPLPEDSPTNSQGPSTS